MKGSAILSLLALAAGAHAQSAPGGSGKSCSRNGARAGQPASNPLVVGQNSRAELPVLTLPKNRASTNGTGSGSSGGSGTKGGSSGSSGTGPSQDAESGGGKASVSLTGTSGGTGTSRAAAALSSKLPASAGTVVEAAAIPVPSQFDGGMKTYERSPSVCMPGVETNEDAAMFIVADGGTLSNVIIGKGQAEGVHCQGTCTLNNVWFASVCEDAFTFLQTAGTSYINGGGAFGAHDKIVQFDGRGTVHISNFYAENYGKLSRSCGNCPNNGGPREIIVEGVKAVNGGELCGVNANFGDKCTIIDSCQAEGQACTIWQATSGGGEATKTATQPDGKVCVAQSFQPTC
ncbi:hypothetical protein KVR01_005805 [Diaporthe batatas]|uniref:uncharacterized protein n=1 Tax=Diaporthe batatas TaxID=748121 RepID=UPI001D03C96D|nr:uncharacterized protein KVR01_005805 [Diaporthe batatas]KAG8163887.1 hypothetical protein KVR01_005805 [Diaporthe batatas]